MGIMEHAYLVLVISLLVHATRNTPESSVKLRKVIFYQFGIKMIHMTRYLNNTALTFVQKFAPKISKNDQDQSSAVPRFL